MSLRYSFSFEDAPNELSIWIMDESDHVGTITISMDDAEAENLKQAFIQRHGNFQSDKLLDLGEKYLIPKNAAEAFQEIVEVFNSADYMKAEELIEKFSDNIEVVDWFSE
jgi:hypothetical protein